MKKLILALIIMCFVAGCTKEEVVDNTIPQKVYVQIVAYNTDGSFYNSEIELAQ